MLRLESGDDSLNEELAFGRTLASTYESSSTAQRNTYAMHMSEFLDTIYFAVWVHDHNAERLQLLLKMWSVISSNR